MVTLPTGAIPLLVALGAAPAPQAASPAAAPPSLMLLVLADGAAVPVLSVELGPDAQGPDARLRVAYWAGPEPSALTTAAGAGEERARAGRVFEAFRTWSQMNGVYEVSISAVAGRPEQRAQVLAVSWTRPGPETWRAGDPQDREVTLPAFLAPAPLASRDRVLERDASSSALAFLAKLDAGRHGEAWGAAAEVLRVTVSREDFERAQQLSARLYGRKSARRLVLWLYPADASRSAAGTLVMIRFVVKTDGGDGVEDVTVRRELDGRWRVAGYQPKARVLEERRKLLPFPTEGLPPGNYTVPFSGR